MTAWLAAVERHPVPKAEITASSDITVSGLVCAGSQLHQYTPGPRGLGCAANPAQHE